jgi:hypothetical protein
MKHSAKFAGLAAAAVLATGLAATSAGAVPVSVSSGDSVDFGNLDFAGEAVSGAGGAGSWFVTFNAASSGTGEALVTIGPRNLSAWTDLMVGWSDGESSVVTPTSTTVSTMFLDPASLSQMLIISWSDSLPGFAFDVEGTVAVSPIPLPAAGLLLIGGLGALGFAGRRKKA